jgi:hypothetical protein
MTSVLDQILTELAALHFTGKGEAFVEARFLTPLLTRLGYERKDYEVIRHGDSRRNTTKSCGFNLRQL